MKGRGGFTLIELLVVITIIGILSAVALVMLSSARNKGSDAAVIQDLTAVRTQAQIYYNGDGGNTYGGDVTNGLCTLVNTMFKDDITIANAILATKSANGGTMPKCTASKGTFAVSSNLPSGGYWCVDSEGTSKKQANTLSFAGNPPYLCAP